MTSEQQYAQRWREEVASTRPTFEDEVDEWVRMRARDGRLYWRLKQ